MNWDEDHQRFDRIDPEELDLNHQSICMLCHAYAICNSEGLCFECEHFKGEQP